MRSSTVEWMDECTEVAEGAIGIAVVSQSRRGCKCVCARAYQAGVVYNFLSSAWCYVN